MVTRYNLYPAAPINGGIYPTVQHRPGDPNHRPRGRSTRCRGR